MHRNRFASRFSAVVLAGTLAAGCSSAAPNATKTAAARGMSAATTTRTATKAGGTVHFIGYSQNSDGPDFTVIVTGAIGDYGSAVTVLPDGTIDPGHTSELRLALKNGSFRLNIVHLHENLENVTTHYQSTPTCSFHASATAATPVVPGSGTGLYRGISGSVNVTVTSDEVDVKPCPGGTSRFISQLIFVTGSGTISFG
jgi:hypothetical protein